VDDKRRHKRLRLLVSELNKERKKQAKKIDILCNDFIAAQREFIKKLDTIGFAANFYEAIVGTSDLNTLILASSNLIKNKIPDSSIAFFLRQQDGFELHMNESSQPITLEKQHLENCFTAELVDNICKSNKICNLDDMFAMGLEGKLTVLNKISAATIPLGQGGSSLGFVLIYRQSNNGVTPDELHSISAVSPGLARAIGAFRAVSHPRE
jgi:hypothetical protein